MRIFVTVIVLVLFPAVTFAASCSPSGMTVVYVNGILTTYPEAKRDLGMLQTEYIDRTRDYSTNFLTGYNQTHLAGGTDIIQSAAQAFGKSVSDFDLNTILMQIQPQVSTRKILLVGHSQGTFYTNSIYKYLTDNGVPEESITVYNLATPADHVEGSGKYLTSTNDKVINGVRPLMAKYGAPAPLSANITIAVPADETNDPAGGHHFGSSYLAMEPDRIVSDIENALGKLKVGFPPTVEECFTPPPKTLGYMAKDATFAVVDPVVQAIKTADVAVVNTIDTGASIAGRAIGIGIIVTGNTVIYAADITARAIIAAAKKASAAASAAASKIRQVIASVNSAAGGVSAASQIAAITPALPKPPVATSQPKTTTAPVPTIAPTPPSAPAQAVIIPPQETATKAPDPPPAVPAIQQQIPIPPVFGPALISVVPGFGGGGGAPAPVPAPQVEEVIVPVYVPLSVQAPPEGALFATSSVVFTGTTTPGYSVVASYAGTAVATVADSSGDWQVILSLPEGATSIGIVATDSAGDTTPPGAPSPSISECTASLSTSFCLIPSKSATLAWPSITGTAYYAYAISGGIFRSE